MRSGVPKNPETAAVEPFLLPRSHAHSRESESPSRSFQLSRACLEAFVLELGRRLDEGSRAKVSHQEEAAEGSRVKLDVCKKESPYLTITYHSLC